MPCTGKPLRVAPQQIWCIPSSATCCLVWTSHWMSVHKRCKNQIPFSLAFTVSLALLSSCLGSLQGSSQRCYQTVSHPEKDRRIQFSLIEYPPARPSARSLCTTVVDITTLKEKVNASRAASAVNDIAFSIWDASSKSLASVSRISCSIFLPT